MEKRIQKTDVVVNKVKRIPIVIFLKRIFPLIVLVLVVSITFLLGVWNLKRFEFNTDDLKYTNVNDLESSLSIFVGKNIFSIQPSDIVKTLVESNGYLRDATVEKILPNKLKIVVKENAPMYVGYSSEKCILFSEVGKKIFEICTECKEECIADSKSDGYISIMSENYLENENRLIYYEEISKIQKLLSTFMYNIYSIGINDGIAVVKDTDEHEFTFDISNDLDTQLARMYLVGQKIDSDMINFRSLDLRFERPVMELK